MAEILSLPCHIGHEGARRLAAPLTAMIKEGHDPGPRGAQIRSLGLTLEALLRALRIELTHLDAADDLDVPIATLERLAHLARTYRIATPTQAGVSAGRSLSSVHHA